MNRKDRVKEVRDWSLGCGLLHCFKNRSQK